MQQLSMCNPDLFGTVRFDSHLMPAITTTLIPGLANSIVKAIIPAGFMPQSVPWMIKDLILTVILHPEAVSLLWVILADFATLLNPICMEKRP